jgi:short-subunit dehydrogenase
MNVVLTGASRGIGYQVALSFCRKKVDNLVLVSRNKERLHELKNECEALNPEIIVTIIAEDIIDLANENTLFERIKSLEKIDILINNAGLLISKPFKDFSYEETKKIFDVNFHAPAQIITQILPLISNSQIAHIINISSIGGFQGSSKYPGLSYYSASKSALTTLTECLSTELTNVKTNCLALGAVQTEMLEEAFPGYEAPVSAEQMGEYIVDFALTGHKYYNGQILPVRLGNP